MVIFELLCLFPQAHSQHLLLILGCLSPVEIELTKLQRYEIKILAALYLRIYFLIYKIIVIIVMRSGKNKQKPSA